MSLLFDIFQLDQLSQIKELSLEGNSTLNDILDLQQNMYEDKQYLNGEELFRYLDSNEIQG